MHRRSKLLAGLVVAATAPSAGLLTTAAPARADGSTRVAAALPATYLSNYDHRAHSCPELVTPPWVNWTSYAAATVGDQWQVTTSATRNCVTARQTADAMIARAPFDDGAGQSLSSMLSYGRKVRIASLSAGPKPAGATWRCASLPSFWAQDAEDLAEIAGQPGLPDGAFAAAGGPAAGAGYCVSAVRSTGTGQWKGGQFFTWAPDTTTCRRRYTLKQTEDPSGDGTTSPPFPADLWGDYDPAPCP